MHGSLITVFACLPVTQKMIGVLFIICGMMMEFGPAVTGSIPLGTPLEESFQQSPVVTPLSVASSAVSATLATPVTTSRKKQPDSRVSRRSPDVVSAGGRSSSHVAGHTAAFASWDKFVIYYSELQTNAVTLLPWSLQTEAQLALKMTWERYAHFLVKVYKKSNGGYLAFQSVKGYLFKMINNARTFLGVQISPTAAHFFTCLDIKSQAGPWAWL